VACSRNLPETAGPYPHKIAISRAIPKTYGGSEARFAAYVEQLGTALGHADRQEPLHDYCLGLLMPIERKSVEPMAAVTALWAFSPRA
jgi:hypothetical protein